MYIYIYIGWFRFSLVKFSLKSGLNRPIQFFKNPNQTKKKLDSVQTISVGPFGLSFSLFSPYSVFILVISSNGM